MLIRNIGKLGEDFTDLRQNVVNLAANPQILLEPGRQERWQAKVSETFSPRSRMVRCRWEVPA
jgi:hypothetical protein